MRKLSLFQRILNLFFPKPIILVRTLTLGTITPVVSYWKRHIVNSAPFGTKKTSLKYLEWRFNEYPLFRELMGLWGDHSDQKVLDYGCGPGNDLVGFLMHMHAKKVIGVDVSEKTLILASRRLSLHIVDPKRVELIQVSDAEPKLSLEDQSLDYIYCKGVLHHTRYLQNILKEIRRILKPEGLASIMVYNRNSIWLHLFTAYEKMIVQDAFLGIRHDEAFTRNTEGVECPIARFYAPDDFIKLCTEAGFHAEYKDGYLSKFEIELLKKLDSQTLQDDRLLDDHKGFLKTIKYDPNGLPMYKGEYAGISGVYALG